MILKIHSTSLRATDSYRRSYNHTGHPPFCKLINMSTIVCKEEMFSDRDDQF